MRHLLVGFLAGLALVSLGEAQESSSEGAASQPFVSGGSVWLKLSSGDYTVSASTSDRAIVRWRVDDPEHFRDMKKIKVRTDVSGSVLTIRTEGPTNHARFTIEIPSRSDLNLRMRAGDVRINGIDGNKDIRMTAGDLNIDVRPASYSTVHASVTFGDLNAQPLGISKDGIARSLNWTGPGKYTLYASLFAGDVTLLSRR
jgi:hypothetical protein